MSSDVGSEMYELMRELYPICRSLSGDGVRLTLDCVSRELPLDVTEVASGTRIFDWTVPKEWNIRSAWISSPTGERVVDFADNNLHVVGYSTPVAAKVSLADLRENLHVHPERSDWIPYRTSYYAERWGFCLTQDQLNALEQGEYEVHIDSTLEDGSITYGEAVVRGRTDDEVLFSTYICHPSLCNDNLSGIVLLTALGKALQGRDLRYSYRFLFSPATIGPLAWLARNEETLDRVKHGLVVSCAGDPGGFTYKRSRRGNAEIDQAVANVLRDSGHASEVLDFAPWGGDERQFGSPGFDLPIGAFSRSPADRFSGYHSSADDLDLVQPPYLAESLETLLGVVDVVESNGRFANKNPKGEPQLGKRGLYRSLGGGSSEEAALLWVLNFSDGSHSLLDISDRSGLPFGAIRGAADKLLDADLLEELGREDD